MSRAFVKEGEDRPEEPIERPISGEPNYVTASGLAALRASLAEAEKNADARNARYYRERVDSAVEVDLAAQPRDRVAFGALVRTLDDRGKTTRVRIVGEDEADPVNGTISWRSPYAQALLEKKVGDRAVVHLPRGESSVRIEEVTY
ncbi:MAG: GreA/GreB family elongation factor [Vulcanimicrobiaceae bacterium]